MATICEETDLARVGRLQPSPTSGCPSCSHGQATECGWSGTPRKPARCRLATDSYNVLESGTNSDHSRKALHGALREPGRKSSLESAGVNRRLHERVMAP